MLVASELARRAFDCDQGLVDDRSYALTHPALGQAPCAWPAEAQDRPRDGSQAISSGSTVLSDSARDFVGAAQWWISAHVSEGMLQLRSEYGPPDTPGSRWRRPSRASNGITPPSATPSTCLMGRATRRGTRRGRPVLVRRNRRTRRGETSAAGTRAEGVRADVSAPLQILLLADDQGRQHDPPSHPSVHALLPARRSDLQPAEPRAQQISETRRVRRRRHPLLDRGHLGHYFSPWFRDQVAAYEGVKVQFIQDEYRCVDVVTTRIREMGSTSSTRWFLARVGAVYGAAIPDDGSRLHAHRVRPGGNRRLASHASATARSTSATAGARSRTGSAGSGTRRSRSAAHSSRRASERAPLRHRMERTLANLRRRVVRVDRIVPGDARK